MPIQTKQEQYFIAANSINWNSGLINGLPRNASLQPSFYADRASGASATVVKADPLQNIQESLCNPAVVRCNVAPGMTLLMADNGPWAPVFLEFPGDGLAALGGYAVAKWDPLNPPVAYTASLYVRLNGSGLNDWIPADTQQGFTGDIWSPQNPSFAPFVGCAATAEDRIVAARFDVGHAQDGSFSPVGISELFFYV
jgi:hypothetical protein